MGVVSAMMPKYTLRCSGADHFGHLQVQFHIARVFEEGEFVWSVCVYREVFVCVCVSFTIHTSPAILLTLCPPLHRHQGSHRDPWPRRGRVLNSSPPRNRMHSEEMEQEMRLVSPRAPLPLSLLSAYVNAGRPR